ncbi:MAG: LysR family transcriptional regulator [Candidatus Ozemobacteraceae bacterium]
MKSDVLPGQSGQSRQLDHPGPSDTLGQLDHLDLQPLFTFYVTATSPTFTEAAERLNLSQSAVSHAIRKLERSVGLRLLVRDQTPIRLTEAGQTLFQTCERVFLDLQRCQDLLRQDDSRPLTGRLRMGATVEFGNSVLSRKIAPFLQEHPRIEPSFTFSHELLKPLLADELDVIIDCKAHARAELSQVSLFRERYVLVAAPSLIERERVRCLSDLERVSWLTIDPAGEWWQRLLVQIPPGTELSPRHMLPVNHLRGLINLAVAGVGVGLVPAYCVLHEVRQGWLQVLFPRLQIREDRFSLYCKRLRRENPKIRAFVTFMKQMEPDELGALKFSKEMAHRE